MKISKNDPRLTAYVLNESDDSERRLIERALHEDPALRLEVELLHKTISRLEKRENNANNFKLTAAQRAEIFSRISKPKKTITTWHISLSGGGLLAAGLVVFFFTHSLKRELTLQDQVRKQPYKEENRPAKPLSPLPGASANHDAKIQGPSKRSADKDYAMQTSETAGTSDNAMTEQSGVNDVAAENELTIGAASAGASVEGFAKSKHYNTDNNTDNHRAAKMALSQLESPAMEPRKAVNYKVAEKKSPAVTAAPELRDESEARGLVLKVEPNVEPSLFQNIRQALQSCLKVESPNNTPLKLNISWTSDGAKLDLKMTPDSGTNGSQNESPKLNRTSLQVCLQREFKNLDWPKPGVFVLSVESASKIDIQK